MTWLSLGLMLFLGLHSTSAFGGDAPVEAAEELFLPSEYSFRNLREIEFTYRQVDHAYGEGIRPEKLEDVVQFCYQRPQFSVRDTYIRGTRYPTTNSCHVAFNGKLFQYFEPADQCLRVTSQEQTLRDITSIELPLVRPYEFACGSRSFLNLDELSRPELWKTLAKRTKIVRKDRLGDFETVVIEVKSEAENFPYTVHMAKELAWYPLRWEISDKNGVTTRLNVTKHLVLDLAGGKLVVPLVVELVTSAPDVKYAVTQTYTIQEDTLRVAHPVRQETFTLTVPRAYLVYDIDKKAVLKGRGTTLPRDSRSSHD